MHLKRYWRRPTSSTLKTKDHLDRALQNLRDHTIPAEPVQRLASRVLWEWGEFMAVVKRHGLAEEVAIKVEEMEPWIADLEKALIQGLRVQIEYVANGKPPTVRIIRPHTAYCLRGKFYVTAFCERVNEERTFRLDRIQGLTLLNPTG